MDGCATGNVDHLRGRQSLESRVQPPEGGEIAKYGLCDLVGFGVGHSRGRDDDSADAETGHRAAPIAPDLKLLFL